MQTISMLRVSPCLAVAPAHNAGKRTPTVASPVRQVNTLRMSARVAPRAVAGRNALVIRAADIPTVSDTKLLFMQNYSKPIPAMFNNIIQELIVSQHLYQVNAKYQYSEVACLGFVSVFDQIFESYKWGAADDIYAAYISAQPISNDPKKCRSDADSLLEAAKASSSASDLMDMTSVKAMAAQAEGGKLLHNKFLSIGLFRMLEVGGYTEPTALTDLVKASGLEQEAVNRDLLQYKGLLSKLNYAKEMQAEFIKRERKKAAEREATKAAAADVVP